jgi:putative ABC transport system permease protein
LGILLAVAMLTAVNGFIVSTKDALLTIFITEHGDYHLRFMHLTAEQADAVQAHEAVGGSFIETDDKGTVSVYFKLKSPTTEFFEQAQRIAAESGITEPQMSPNLEQLALEGYLNNSTVMILLYTIGAVLTLIIMTASVIVIANAFTISAGERVGQFGVLKSAGATREQIRLSVLFEGAALSLVGIPLGVLLGFGILWIGVSLIHFYTSNLSEITTSMIRFRVLFSPAALAVSVVLSFLTVTLSAWFPARRVSRLSAIDAIRQTGEIKIRAKAVKTSRLTEKIFGFEGTLAAKSLKRSKRKYRATVISLVTSIVLVLVSTSFGNMLIGSFNTVYPNMDVAVRIAFNEDALTAQQARAYYAALDGYADTGASLTMGGNRYFNTVPPENFLTTQATEYLNGARVNAILFDDATYERLCKESGANPGDALIINHLQPNRKTRLTPFDKWRQTLTVSDGAKEYALALSAQIREPDALLSAFCLSSMVNVVIPLSQLEKWGLVFEAVFLSDSRDVPGFLAFAEAQMDQIGAADYRMDDIAAETAASKNIYMLIMVFIYGFVGLLSLIGATSVISTISTNIQLRARELAALASIGMTPRGLHRMLNLESLLYGLKSIVIGIPLGLALSYGLYYLFGLLAAFPFIVPWAGMGICAAGVFLITFASMRYASYKVRGASIMETIRAVNV